MNLNEIFAIITSDKEGKSDSEKARDFEQLGFFIRMNGFKTQQARGVYNDIPEDVWLVTGSPSSIGWSLFELMTSMAQSYYQDSFIICDGTGSAQLMDFNGKKLKTFTTIYPAAPSDTSYTIMPDGTRLTLR
jgi:hypothetical protein